MAYVSSTTRRASILVDRVETWLAAWFRALREMRSEAELARKLEGVDEHLLRDMGLTRTGRRFERIGRDETP